MVDEFPSSRFQVSTDPERLDVNVLQDFLSTSYWAKGRTLEQIKRTVAHSLPFGLFENERQIGFARVLTDYVTFAYVADVFILEEFRGRGLGRWLMNQVISHPELQEVRTWFLGTRDAHDLYRQVGFTELTHPEMLMERLVAPISHLHSVAEDCSSVVGASDRF